jgi:hypothetical protein
MTRNSQLTRRTFSAGLLAAASLSCCPICRAAGKTGLFEGGKVLCASAAGGVPTEEALLSSSGDSNLDRILAAEMIQQAKFFGMRPAFMLYSGPNQNALASSRTVLAGTQGTILYNLPFLQSQLKSGDWGGAIVAGVLAHEFSHIYQFYSPYGPRLEALHNTVKFPELHADYVSAFYMAKKYVADKVKLDSYFDEFYRLGDYDFNTKDHHGTREERYFAVKSGHNLSLLNKDKGIDFAAAQGEALLREYFR